MTPNSVRSAVGRVFVCWPSRIGAASLLALALSWGSEELSTTTQVADASIVAGVAAR